MELNLATFLNLQWGLKEGLLGYPFGTVDYGKAPVGGSQVTVRGGSDPRSKPLLLHTIFDRKIPLSYTFFGTPFTKLV